MNHRDKQSVMSADLQNIKHDMKDHKTDLFTKIDAQRVHILREIESIDKRNSEAVMSSLDTFGELMRDLQSSILQIPVQHRILQHIAFDEMRLREQQIEDVEYGTSQWLIGDDRIDFASRESARLNLQEWLTKGQGVFHISGYPGAGKSTLVKFIARHEKTAEALRIWAGSEKKLVIASHYFWNSGTPAQRTVSGMNRTLLFSILSQCTELIEEVFPVESSLLNKEQRGQHMESILFSDKKIEEALDNLMSIDLDSAYRLCVFVDGLDECDGNMLDHESLAKKLVGWSRNNCVKICASSRPWKEFNKLACPHAQTIHLHKINEWDIEMYCNNRFERDEEIKRSSESYEYLINDIVRHSHGVFRWVHLVIDIILIAIRNGDSPDDLKKKLLEMPDDLDGVYDKLRVLALKNSSDWVRSNRILLLAVQNPFRQGLSLIPFSWLESDDELRDLEFPQDLSLKSYSTEEIDKRESQVIKRIQGLARGFLEVKENRRMPSKDITIFERSSVEFVHRTAREYFMRESHPERLASLLESFPGFSEGNTYDRVRLAELVFGATTSLKASFPAWFGKTWSLGSWLQRSRYPNTMDSERVTRLTQKFRNVIQQIDLDWQYQCNPMISQYYLWPITSSEQRYSTRLNAADSIPGSFIHYAAYNGLSHIVLAEMQQQCISDMNTSSVPKHLNALISAIEGARWELVLALLATRINLDDEFRIWRQEAIYDGESCPATSIPLWLFALIRVIHSILWPGYGNNHEANQFQALWLLSKYGREKGDEIKFSVSFETERQEVPIETEYRFKIIGFTVNDLLVAFSDKLNGRVPAELALANHSSQIKSDDQTCWAAIKDIQHFYIISIQSTMYPDLALDNYKFRVF